MLGKHRSTLGAAALLLFLGCGPGSEEGGGTAEIPLDAVVETDEDKTFYAMGLGLFNMARINMDTPQPFLAELSEAELEGLFGGLADFALDREPRINPREYGPQMRQWLTDRQGSEGSPPPTVEANPDDSNTVYAMGQAIGGATFIAPLKGKWTAAQLGLMRKGFFDAGLKREPLVDFEAYAPKATEYLRAQMALLVEAEKKKSEAFLEQAAQEDGAVRTETGLVYKELVAGTGATPTLDDVIKIHYHGALTDGTVFDSTVDKGQPLTYPLKQFIQGWKEGLTMMKVGGKAKLTIPSDLAYGDAGNPPVIPPAATLVFEIELLEIVEKTADAAGDTPEG